jgi:hypothetical protein
VWCFVQRGVAARRRRFGGVTVRARIAAPSVRSEQHQLNGLVDGGSVVGLGYVEKESPPEDVPGDEVHEPPRLA